jgi:hypothetical protein
MKILEKIKSLIPSRQKAESKDLSMCDLILERIDQKKKNAKHSPSELTKQEWTQILNEISFAFKVTKSNSTLKSPARKKQRKKKIENSFTLFEKYLKEL